MDKGKSRDQAAEIPKFWGGPRLVLILQAARGYLKLSTFLGVVPCDLLILSRTVSRR